MMIVDVFNCMHQLYIGFGDSNEENNLFNYCQTIGLSIHFADNSELSWTATMERGILKRVMNDYILPSVLWNASILIIMSYSSYA